MFYAFELEWPDGAQADTEYSIDMPLTAGIIHQVDVLFQKDCAHKINVQIWQANFQLWPSNRGKSLKGDATVISFREFYELKGAVNDLRAIFWTTDVTVQYEVIVQIGLLPRAILQPLNFDYLVAALAGLQ